MLRYRTLTCTVLAIVIAAGCFCEPANAAEPTAALTLPNSMLQAQPTFFIRADVDKGSRAYQAGETLKVSVLTEIDAFVYVLYQQSDGKVFQIFPNAHQSDNKIKAKTRLEIPAKDDEFRWQVSAPFGKESIKVIASREPLTKLDLPELKQKRFNPVGQGVLKDLSETLVQAEPAKWAEDVVEITTYGKQEQPPVPAHKRFGVFFGNSKYRFNEEAKEASGGKWSPNLPACHNGALTLSRFMKDFGHLDDSRVYVNEESTKKQMEESLTKWLPAVSKPGDTIFLFNAGHGGEVLPEHTASGKAMYFLVMHDYVDTFILSVLFKRQDEGKLDAALKPEVDSWRELLRGAKTIDQQFERITRKTSVTDDQLGHWLQRLSGRQVIVILDTCHAAGFATGGKSLEPEDPPPFNFLNSQCGRLKDIGQNEIALLAACGAHQESYGLRLRDEALVKWRSSQKGLFEEWATDDLAVLTYFVCDSLMNSPAPLTIEDCTAQCQKGMQKYFDETNALYKKDGKDGLKPHQAALFNYCTKPVLLKP